MVGQDDPIAWQWATEGVQKDFAAAYADFRQALARAFPSPETVRAAADAYVAYTTALQEPWQSGDLVRRVNEFGKAYTSAVQEALSGAESQAHIDAAFKRYVSATQAAWAVTEVAAVQPADLFTIAQSMAWIASIAGEIRRGPSA